MLCDSSPKTEGKLQTDGKAEEARAITAEIAWAKPIAAEWGGGGTEYQNLVASMSLNSVSRNTEANLGNYKSFQFSFKG